MSRHKSGYTTLNDTSDGAGRSQIDEINDKGPTLSKVMSMDLNLFQDVSTMVVMNGTIASSLLASIRALRSKGAFPVRRNMILHSGRCS